MTAILADNSLLLLIGLVVTISAITIVFLLRDRRLPEGDQNQEQIRVLVVDSNGVARDTLTKFLQFDKSLKIVGAASTGSDALEAAKQFNPNVVLLDLNLVDINSLDLARSISRQFPGVGFVFLQEVNLPLPGEWPVNLSEPLVKPVDYHQLLEAIHKAERMF